jgi:hypothetical protein
MVRVSIWRDKPGKGSISVVFRTPGRDNGKELGTIVVGGLIGGELDVPNRGNLLITCRLALYGVSVVMKAAGCPVEWTDSWNRNGMVCSFGVA